MAEAATRIIKVSIVSVAFIMLSRFWTSNVAD